MKMYNNSSENRRGLVALKSPTDIPSIRRAVERQEIPVPEFVVLADILESDIVPTRPTNWLSIIPAYIRNKLALDTFAGSVFRDFEHVYFTGEDVAFPLGVLLRIFGNKGVLLPVVHNVGHAKGKFLMRFVGNKVFSHVICVSQCQADILLRECATSPHKISTLFNWIDTEFFRPAAPVENFIFACGREGRDYNTLINAISGAEIKLTVVASGFHGSSGLSGSFSGAENIDFLTDRLSFQRLRELYQRSRFVVLPLLDLNYAAGVTGLLEAMACGKAVIASDSVGMNEYFRDNPGILRVPVGDADALRAAIADLWHRREECTNMGESNRRWVLENCSVERYATSVKDILARSSIG